MLPLFCLSMLLGCKDSGSNETTVVYNEVEKYLSNYNYDDFDIVEVKYETTSFYLVYVYYSAKKISGEDIYGISVYCYNNGNIEWLYTYSK